MTTPTERSYNPWNLANRVIPDGEITRILTTYGLKEKPASMDLFRQACIHRSYVDRPEGPLSSTEEVVVVVPRPEGCMPLCTADNEAIEFVGDSLLGCVIALYLHERYPEADEGFLTRLRTRLVNNKSLGELATISAPMFPPAPGLLSTNIGCPQPELTFSPIVRKVISPGVPGGKDTTIRTGLFGHA